MCALKRKFYYLALLISEVFAFKLYFVTLFSDFYLFQPLFPTFHQSPQLSIISSFLSLIIFRFCTCNSIGVTLVNTSTTSLDFAQLFFIILGPPTSCTRFASRYWPKSYFHTEICMDRVLVFKRQLMDLLYVCQKTTQHRYYLSRVIAWRLDLFRKKKTPTKSY